MLILKILGAVVVVALLALVVWTLLSSRPAFDERRDPAAVQTIADPAEALTFARSADALLRVLTHEGDAVTGIDLTAALGAERTADLVALHAELGWDGLAAIEGETVRVPLDALTLPVDYRYPYVAVGTNYAEHAAEVNLDDPPFLFPKLARASAWNSAVNFTARLDYEAELGVVPLADIRSADDDVPFGLVLVNDFFWTAGPCSARSTSARPWAPPASRTRRVARAFCPRATSS